MPPRLGVRPLSFEPSLLYPTANANGPYSVIAGTAVLLSRRGSSDPYVVDGYDCYWLPGDGRAELGPYVGPAGDISVQYDTAGTFQARLRIVSQTTGLQRIAYAIVVVQSIASVATVLVTPDAVDGVVGTLVTLQAAAYDSNGQPVTSLPFTWATTDAGVAELQTTTGGQIQVRLAGAGTANVTATCGGVDSADVPFTVTAVSAVYSIVLAPSTVSAPAGTNIQFTATVTD